MHQNKMVDRILLTEAQKLNQSTFFLKDSSLEYSTNGIFGFEPNSRPLAKIPRSSPKRKILDIFLVSFKFIWFQGVIGLTNIYKIFALGLRRGVRDQNALVMICTVGSVGVRNVGTRRWILPRRFSRP